MTCRDFDKQPYTDDEKRVCEYIRKITKWSVWLVCAAHWPYL